MIPSNHNVLIKAKQVGANVSIEVRLELRQSHLQHVWYEEAEGICIFSRVHFISLLDYIICKWISAACWANSFIMASSKNLLMLTSSLMPCKCDGAYS